MTDFFVFSDYGALLTENGDYTAEYLMYQELFHAPSGTSNSLSVMVTQPQAVSVL